jgi:hypothetical protein
VWALIEDEKFGLVRAEERGRRILGSDGEIGKWEKARLGTVDGIARATSQAGTSKAAHSCFHPLVTTYPSPP